MCSASSHPTTTVNADLEAKIALSVSFAAIPPSHEGAYLGVNFSLADPTGSIVREFVYDLSTDDLDSSPPDTEEKLTPGKVDKWITGAVFTKFEFEAGGVELWWSVGLGGQPLYTAKAELLDSVCLSLTRWSKNPQFTCRKRGPARSSTQSRSGLASGA